jgi:hypothetical protein
VRRGRSSRSRPAAVSLGGTSREDLPFPIVFYPNHCGTFFAFAEDDASDPALCACSRDPIENLLKLKTIVPTSPYADPCRMALLDSWFFPDVVAERSMHPQAGVLSDLRFIEGLCHRCNLVPPTLRYCHEMYGTKFIQHFGWYVNQAYLRLGIKPMSLEFLTDTCPQEFQVLIKRSHDANLDFQREEKRLMDIVSGPARDDIAADEITYWRNVREEDTQEMISLRRQAARATRAVTKRVENIVREEFGFRKVGEAWVSETLLFQLISRIFHGREVLRHHRPDWMEGLELDMYVPSIKLALEYQGQQHFHPVDAWGGEKALKELKERDRRKASICEVRGVCLVAFHYTEPLTEEHIRLRLQEVGIGIGNIDNGSA